MSFLKWFSYLLALGLFVYLVFFSWNIGESQSSIVPELNENEVEDTLQTDEIIDDAFVDEKTELDGASESNTSEERVDDEPVNTPENTAEKSPEVVETPVSVSDGFDYSKKYLIVVGSFGVKSNAERMKNRVIKDGRKADIKLIDGLHRVIVEATDDRTNARQVRDHFTLIYGERAFVLIN